MLRLLTLSAANAAILGTAQALPHLVHAHEAMAVRYDDLHLSTDAGARVFMTRIEPAVEAVCGGKPSRNGAYSAQQLTILTPAYDKCRQDAIR